MELVAESTPAPTPDMSSFRVATTLIFVVSPQPVSRPSGDVRIVAIDDSDKSDGRGT